MHTVRRKPTVHDNARRRRLVHTVHGPHAVRQPRVKDCQLIEVGLDQPHEVGTLDDRARLEVGPEGEGAVGEEHRFAAGEAAVLPRREGEHKGPRAVRVVAVQLLPAALCTLAGALKCCKLV